LGIGWLGLWGILWHTEKGEPQISTDFLGLVGWGCLEYFGIQKKVNHRLAQISTDFFGDWLVGALGNISAYRKRGTTD